MLAGVSTDRSESAELRRFGRGAAVLPRDCRAAGCPGDWDPVIGEPMFAGVSMGQSESAELTSSAGVGEFTFPRPPHTAIAFARTIGEPKCDSANYRWPSPHGNDMLSGKAR
jgi:hypothetical protein